MCIRVVNVRGIKDAERRSQIVYVGRSCDGWPRHALCNIFKPGRRFTVNQCLERYRQHICDRGTLDADLAALWIQTEYGCKPLGCWCVNATLGDGQTVVCHAQVLAEMLAERFCSQALAG